MLKNILERGRPQMAIWRMLIACSITKATDTHSEYVMLVAFPLQQCLHKRAPMLRCTYIACLVVFWYLQTFLLGSQGKSYNESDDYFGSKVRGRCSVRKTVKIRNKWRRLQYEELGNFKCPTDIVRIFKSRTVGCLACERKLQNYSCLECRMRNWKESGAMEEGGV
jgi:hypothetical protein